MLYNFENGRDIIQDRPCKGADNVGEPAAIFELKKKAVLRPELKQCIWRSLNTFGNFHCNFVFNV